MVLRHRQNILFPLTSKAFCPLWEIEAQGMPKSRNSFCHLLMIFFGRGCVDQHGVVIRFDTALMTVITE
jgi:hypothetical protein